MLIRLACFILVGKILLKFLYADEATLLEIILLYSQDPSTKSVEENWTQFKSILFDTIKKHIPQRTPNKKKSTPWLNFHALNVLFAKSSIVTMLPDIAIMNKIGTNLKFFEKWYIMKCGKLTKTTSTNS